eukprot:scaffold1513_cov177-Isochrysis_galbana.AAC.9
MIDGDSKSPSPHARAAGHDDALPPPEPPTPPSRGAWSGLVPPPASSPRAGLASARAQRGRGSGSGSAGGCGPPEASGARAHSALGRERAAAVGKAGFRLREMSMVRSRWRLLRGDDESQESSSDTSLERI